MSVKKHWKNIDIPRTGNLPNNPHVKFHTIYITDQTVKSNLRCIEVLFDSVEQEYLFYYSNLVVNGCFLIAKPHKYHILPKRNRAVYVPELINIFITLQKLVSLLYKTLIFLPYMKLYSKTS